MILSGVWLGFCRNRNLVFTFPFFAHKSSRIRTNTEVMNDRFVKITEDSWTITSLRRMETSKEISIDTLLSILNDMATMLDLLEENQFKVRAVQNAVRILEDANFEYLDLGAIAALPGIGKGTLATVREFAETGMIAEHQKLTECVPASVLEMTNLRGLGAKKVRALWQDVGITSIAELSNAANAHRIADTKGFGAKTEANIVEAIKQYYSGKEQFHLHKAVRESERLRALLAEVAGITRCEIAGEAAQGAETVRSIVLVAECAALETIVLALRSIAEFAGFAEASEGEKKRFHGTTEHDFPCAIVLAKSHEYVLSVHEYTSAPEYHAAFLKKLDNSKLEDRSNTSPDAQNEAELYKKAHLPLVPPELRINPTLLDRSDLAEFLPNIATDQQMRGILHVHSTWSDGKHSIRQMAERAQTLGYEYIAICDHSKTAVYAGGLTEERVRQQHEEIDALNEELRGLAKDSDSQPIRILKGIESDILRDGALDYSDAVLETFDVVVASVHSSFSLDKKTMTERVIRALEHPKTTLLGHPTGRLLLKRKGYELDFEAIFAVAKQHEKAIEINANPHRLDLSAENAALAQRMGVHLAINTDAHNRDDIAYMRYGVQVARRAGLRAESVINTLTLAEFCAAFSIQQ
jgi:DNA polymerase (family 10)